VDQYPDAEGIPARNIQKLREMGLERVLAVRSGDE
jgi:hypothetical protein